MAKMDGTYDLAVIGAGPGGYVAAIRAAQLGMSVVCIDKRGTLGGTCLNVGCIPSKVLLTSSEKFVEIGHGLERFGISAGKPSLDLAAMLENKDKNVNDNTNGVAYLFKKNKITAMTGAARLAGKGAIEIANGAKRPETIQAGNIVIATGSEPIPLRNVPIDEKRIVTSTGALSLESVPKRMVVVGGGYIGLELGSVWHRLGAEVTVVEFLDRVVPVMDREIGQQFKRILEKQGLKFRLSMKVTSAETTKTGVSLKISSANGGNEESLEADVVLVAIGRRPFTEGLGLAEAGVAIDNSGRIKTDEHFRTSAEGVYAIGDVIAGPQLAHKASDEGIAVAEILAGQAGHVNYEAIPSVVYTAPEVASVGRTEEELRDAGVLYKVGKFPFTANPRARIYGATEGMVKILADAKTDRILGVHILGADAGTIIHEAVVAMEFGGSAEDLARICHAHPTLNEAVHEAALAVGGRAIHI